MSGTATVAAPETQEPADRKLGWALALICIAQLMVVLDATIVNIALPFIRKDLNFDPGNLQWIVTGFALAFGGLLLLGGRLGDLYGRRRVFIIGLTLFAVASAVGGLAQSEAMILISRAIQGVGAALASPSALALITTTFPAGPARNRAFSAFATMSAVGAAIGLIVGGALTGWNIGDFHGWRLTFLINVPIGLGAAFLAPRWLKESESHKGELDIPGALSVTFGLFALVYGVTRGGVPDVNHHTHWGDWQTLALLIGGGVLLLAFVVIERIVKHPLLPMRILLNRNRGVAFVSMMIVPAAMFTMFFFLGQFIQTVMGYSPIQTGLAFLPFTFGMGMGAAVSQKLVAKFDPRFIAGTGTIFAGIGLFFFSRISIQDSPAQVLHQITQQANSSTPMWMGHTVNYWTDIFPFIVLMSFGMALTFIPMMLAALHGIDERDAGVSSGVLNTMQQLGGALGLAVLATVAFHQATSFAGDLGGKIGQLTHGGVSQAMCDHAAGATASFCNASNQVFGQTLFTHATVTAVLVGAFMMWTASALIWIFLGVKHEELQTDAPVVA